MAFSDNLQFLRSRQGLTQEQLAEALGVSRQSVSKWESGLSFPEMDTILRLCDLFSVSMDTLLRGDAAAETQADTAGYDAFMNRFALKIALAVGAIILAVALCALMEGLGVPELAFGAMLIAVVAVSVTVLVASGIQYDNFCKRHPVIPDFYTQAQRESFHDRFVWYIAGSIGAIILGAALCALAFAFLPEEEPFETFVGAGMLLIVAAAVTVMIWAGVVEDKYRIDKYNRTNERELHPTEEDKKRNERVGRVCAAVMALAAAVYLYFGFTRDAWGNAWWVFPVGGVLCGVASILLGPSEEE